jgi:RNA polymerase sigma-70 factor (ECF subfamily)
MMKLSAIVEEMPPKMRQAFRLHKLEGLSHAETAEAMEVSVSAVEKHISAALKLLLRKLE